MLTLLAILLAMIAGIAMGRLSAISVAKNESAESTENNATLLELIKHQYEMQLVAARHAQNTIRSEEAYDRLAIWLHQLERSIDEIWFGCATDDKAAEQRAQNLIDEWPWETLRIPSESSAAQFYWSKKVRGDVRRFSDESQRFVLAASIWLVTKQKPVTNPDATSNLSVNTWEKRLDLLNVIDDIRAHVSSELAAEHTSASPQTTPPAY